MTITTDKQQPPIVPEQMPERVWIGRQAFYHAEPPYGCKPENGSYYARVQPSDDARVGEIRSEQTRRRLQALPDYVAPRFTGMFADVEYLLSLLPQLSSSEPRLKDGGVEVERDVGTCPNIACGHVCHWGEECPDCDCIGIPRRAAQDGPWAVAIAALPPHKRALFPVTTAPAESSERRCGEGRSFKEFLAEQMKDPEFRAAYDQISAEEDVKLAALFDKMPPMPNENPEYRQGWIDAVEAMRGVAATGAAPLSGQFQSLNAKPELTSTGSVDSETILCPQCRQPLVETAARDFAHAATGWYECQAGADEGEPRTATGVSTLLGLRSRAARSKRM